MESMADKKDPVTSDMVRWLQSQAPTAGSTSVSAAIADWTTLGLSAGFESVNMAKPQPKFGKNGRPHEKMGQPNTCPELSYIPIIHFLMSNGVGYPCTTATKHIMCASPGANKRMAITADMLHSEKRSMHNFAQC